MREEDLALDGRALQSSSKDSPGGDEAPEDKKGRECSDRPVLSLDLRVTGVSAFGQVEPGRSGGGSCGERKGEGSVPRGLSPTPGTCRLEGSLVGEGRGRPVDPTHLAADLHPCNGMSSPRELEDVARESGMRDEPMEALVRDGGSVSRVRRMGPTKKRNERRSNRRSEPPCSAGREAVAEHRCKNWPGWSCKLPLPGGEDPAPQRV